MSRLRRALIPIVIIVVAIVVAKIMVSNRAPADRQRPPAVAPLVQVQTLQAQDYQVQVASRGVVQAHTQGSLVAQAGGEIIEINAEFRDGGYFEANETLLQIDPRDYRLAVITADSELAQAKQLLAEEQARSAQAQRDWERLGGDGAPNDLALRKPQLAGAKANLASAQARLGQARLNLERTKVSVPYAGRVLSKNVGVGQVVGVGALLGEVYATDKVEVRLPLSNRQLARLSIPEQYRDAVKAEAVQGPEVTLLAQVGERVFEWQGRVVRSAGAIDANSRQTFVVAQIEDPYARREDNAPPLKVGQYVEARILGELLQGVFVLPRSALRGEDLAYVVKDGALDERRLEIAWQDDNAVVVRGGLRAGEQLVTTVPGAAAPGMQVRLTGEKAREKGMAKAESNAGRPKAKPGKPAARVAQP